MKKNLSIIPFILILVLLFTSCDFGKLSRSKAKRMIREHYGFPLAHGIAFSMLDVKDKCLQKGVVKKYVRPSGKLVLGASKYERTDYGWSFIIVGERGVKGRKAWMTDVLELSKVTGITQGENQAQVNVELVRRSLTPWGECIGNMYEGEIVKKTVSFQKFDDGWRISSFENHFGYAVPLESVPHLNPENKFEVKEGEAPKLEFFTKSADGYITLYVTAKGREIEITDWEDNVELEIDNVGNSDCLIMATCNGGYFSQDICARMIGGRIEILQESASTEGGVFSEVIKVIN